MSSPTPLLVGRKREIEALHAAYEASHQMSCQLVLLSGHGGTGKSSLVRNVFTSRDYAFCQGRFDRLKPVRAFPTLTSLLEDASQALVADGIQMELPSDQANVLGRLVPSLLENRLVIPNQVILQDESFKDLSIPDAVAAQAPDCKMEWCFEKLKQTILAFVQAVTQALPAKKSLILFFDDLQWADLDSLGIFQALVEDVSNPSSELQKKLLIIGSYRDEEVGEGDPISDCIRSAHDNLPVTNIHVQNLSQSDTILLVSQALAMKAKEVEGLGLVVFQTTQGNCFFAVYLLRHIQSSNLLVYSKVEAKWEWDLGIIQTEISSSKGGVADFLIHKLRALPESSLIILRVASCIGARVDVPLLTLVLQQQPGCAHHNSASLQEALQKLSQEQLLCLEPDGTAFRFAHDRIYSAAYGLVDRDQKQTLHLQIGQSLHAAAESQKKAREQTPDDDRRQKKLDSCNLQLVAAADQLTRGRQRIDSVGRVELARLNLQAAKILTQTGAFKAAKGFLEVGIEVLGLQRWAEHYDLTLQLHSFLATVQFANGCMQECLSSIKTIGLYSRCVEDEAPAKFVHVQVLSSPVRLDECLDEGRTALENLGVRKLPKKVGLLNVVANMMRVGNLLKGKDDEDLVNLPLCEDTSKTWALRQLGFLASVAFFADKQLLIPVYSCQAVELSLLHGVNECSAQAFASYAFSLTVTGDFDGAVRFGKLALRLMSRFGEEPRTLFTVYGLLHHIRTPIHDSVNPTLHAYQVAYAQGDLAFVGQAANMHIQTRLVAGLNLNSLANDAQPLAVQLKKYNQHLMRKVLLVFLRLALELTDRSEEMAPITGGDHLNDDQFEVFVDPGSAESSRFLLRFMHMQLRFYLGDQDAALRNAQLCWRSGELQGALCYAVPYFLISALVALDHWREKPRCRSRYWKLFRKYRREIKLWYSRGDMNCGHLAMLLQAEKMSSCKKPHQQVHETFWKSIQQAQKSGFVHDAALACERAAQYMVQKDDLFWAEDHLKRSIDLYCNWGAAAKVQQLKAKYSHLLGSAADDSSSLGGHSRSSASSGIKSLKGRSRALDIEEADAAHGATLDNVIVQLQSSSLMMGM